MSARGENHWKLGLFVVSTVALGVAALVWLGASRFDVETVERVTYFDESVQGLELGAPVKMRGVTIGKVTVITIAPDHRLVEVRANIRVAALRRLGLSDPDRPRAADDVPDDLRVLVASTGITGVKFLEVDFLPDAQPAPGLSFTPPRNYIPSAPSTIKSLEDAVRNLAEELPGALDDARGLARTLEERVEALDTGALSDRLTDVLARVDETLEELDGPRTARELRAMISELRAASRSIEDLSVSLESDGGPIDRVVGSVEGLSRDAREALSGSDLPATTAALREAGTSYRALAEDAQQAVVQLRHTLRRLEDLAGYLERDPGALLRGRSPR